MIYGLEGFDGHDVLGHRQGRRQRWPVYAQPPPPQPAGVVGWTCPPHAPLSPVRFRGTIGYSCVEGGPLGQATSTVGGGQIKPVHVVLVGLGLLAAGYVMTREESRR